jgi:hypothetical protein
MTRDDVLRRLGAEEARGTNFTDFGYVAECRACRRFIATEGGLSTHTAWHRKQSRKFPAEFWASTRFIHHMLVAPAALDDCTVTNVNFTRICNIVANDETRFRPGLVLLTLGFIAAHRRLLREAGFNIRNKHPRQDFYLVDEAAFVFIFDLYKAAMDPQEIRAVVENMKHTRSPEAA